MVKRFIKTNKVGSLSAMLLMMLPLQPMWAGTSLPNAPTLSGGVIRSQQANTQKCGGIIKDATGEPIIGATVRKPGTNVAALTDIDGHFTIDVPEGTMLSVSYIGYKDQTVRAARNMTVTLQPDVANLNEVVVVGYGVQKRASVTGSVASVQAKDLVTVKSAKVTNALAGKLPGLRAVQRSGAPGDDGASIDVRGFGSALVIVDGVQRDFSQIDPNDIESVSILKDASAAVYGFKGANGVILVKTKGGEKGKATINYNGYYGIQQITRYPRLYNGYEYASLYNEAQQNVGVTPSYSAEELENFRNGIGVTDWYNATIRKSSPMTYHNLSVSGGTDRIKYYFAAGFLGQEGIYRSGDYNYHRYNVRSNITATIRDGLKVGMQLSGRFDKREKPYEPDPISRSIQMALPVTTIYANNNERYFTNPGDKGNPVQMSQIGNIGYSRRNRHVFNGSVNIDWEVPWVKGLSVKGLFSYDYTNVGNKNWYKEFYEYGYNAASDSYSVSRSHVISELT